MIYEILTAKNPYAKELDIALFREPPSTKDAKKCIRNIGDINPPKATLNLS